MSAPAAPSGHGAYRATTTFSALDGLRALSITGVVWHHTAEPHTTTLSGRGFLGVDLFFVISGFLIVTLLLRERDKKGAISLRNFYIRRSLRIFPLYYGWLAGLAAVFFFSSHSGAREAFFRDLPIAAAYLGNWIEPAGFLAITWSLAAEEQFYLVWPPLERFATKAVPLVLGVALVASQVVAFGVVDDVFGFDDHRPFMLKQTGFTPILLGVALAHALHSEAGYRRVRAVVDHGVVVVAIVVAIVALLAFGPVDLRGGPRTLLHVLLALLLAACVVREDSGWNRVLQHRVFTWIGVLSYGLYLLHMPARHVVVAVLGRLHIQSAGLTFAATLLLGAALAWLSHRFFERRFLALKGRFAP